MEAKHQPATKTSRLQNTAGVHDHRNATCPMQSDLTRHHPRHLCDKRSHRIDSPLLDRFAMLKAGPGDRTVNQKEYRECHLAENTVPSISCGSIEKEHYLKAFDSVKTLFPSKFHESAPSLTSLALETLSKTPQNKENNLPSNFSKTQDKARLLKCSHVLNMTRPPNCSGSKNKVLPNSSNKALSSNAFITHENGLSSKSSRTTESTLWSFKGLEKVFSPKSTKFLESVLQLDQPQSALPPRTWDTVYQSKAIGSLHQDTTDDFQKQQTTAQWPSSEADTCFKPNGLPETEVTNDVPSYHLWERIHNRGNQLGNSVLSNPAATKCIIPFRPQPLKNDIWDTYSEACDSNALTTKRITLSKRPECDVQTSNTFNLIDRGEPSHHRSAQRTLPKRPAKIDTLNPNKQHPHVSKSHIPKDQSVPNANTLPTSLTCSSSQLTSSTPGFGQESSPSPAFSKAVGFGRPRQPRAATHGCFSIPTYPIIDQHGHQNTDQSLYDPAYSLSTANRRRLARVQTILNLAFKHLGKTELSEGDFPEAPLLISPEDSSQEVDVTRSSLNYDFKLF